MIKEKKILTEDNLRSVFSLIKNELDNRNKNVWLTQEEYDNLEKNGLIEEDTTYNIYE